MVGFQEVVEIWEVYWFGRYLGRGWWEYLLCKVAKGRLKMGFRRPLVWVERGSGLERPSVCPKACTRFDAGYSLLWYSRSRIWFVKCATYRV